MNCFSGVLRRTAFALMMLASLGFFAMGQAVGAAMPTYDAATIESAKAVAMIQVQHLADAFIESTQASGLSCAIAPPKLVIEDIPSYGNYDPDTNTLHTSLWELLKPEERALFFHMADAADKKQGSSEAAARREFETGVHHWVFIHELGHWWQSCRKVNENRKPWAVEYEADRIAAAYWREHDGAVAQHMDAGLPAYRGQHSQPGAGGQGDYPLFQR